MSTQLTLITTPRAVERWDPERQTWMPGRLLGESQIRPDRVVVDNGNGTTYHTRPDWVREVSAA